MAKLESTVEALRSEASRAETNASTVAGLAEALLPPTSKELKSVKNAPSVDSLGSSTCKVSDLGDKRKSQIGMVANSLVEALFAKLHKDTDVVLRRRELSWSWPAAQTTLHQILSNARAAARSARRRRRVRL